MSLRVNLMREAEYRYQGPVSRKFVLRVSVITAAAVAFLLLTISVHQQISLSRNLKTTKEDWQSIETRFKTATALRDKLNAHQTILNELGKWEKSRPDWTRALENLQTIVPSTIQITKLNVRGEWQFIQPPTPPAKEGETTAPKAPPMVPARRIAMNLEGKASGELADETVIQFVKTIRESAELNPMLESVKLQRLLREAALVDMQADRVFEIQGEFFLRKLE